MKITWRRFCSGESNCVEAGAVTGWKTASANSNSCVEVADARPWQKNSVGNGACVEIAEADWTSGSTYNGNCVHVAAAPEASKAYETPAVLVRDSKRPEGKVQPYTRAQWDTVLADPRAVFLPVNAADTSWPEGKDGQLSLYSLPCPCGDGNSLYFTQAEVDAFISGVEQEVFATL